MIPDIDIWRCAQLMTNNHGDEAAMEAATMADEWLSKGNIEAQRVWMRIAKASLIVASDDTPIIEVWDGARLVGRLGTTESK